MGVTGRVSARPLVTVLALTCAALGLAACGTSAASGNGAVVDWFVVPGRGDPTALADSCARAAGGAYSVRLHDLPADVDDRHTELVRRLSGASASVDVVSLDTSIVPEMAEAGFLAPLSAAQQQRWGDGVVPAALAASSRDGELVAAPWWFDPQLLWFRGATAERAGLDTTAPITWDDLIGGAGTLGVPVLIDDVDGTGLSEWVAALTAAGGGSLSSGLDSPAAVAAASLIEFYADSQRGTGPTTDAIGRFAGAEGGFLLASSSALSTSSMQVVAAELGVTAYPVVSGTAPAPAAGISLGVARDSRDKAASAQLISCLTAAEQQKAWVVATGHGSPRTAIYDDEAVTRDSPSAAAVQEALKTAQTVPVTPSWTVVRRAIDSTWQPIADLSAATTPKKSQRLAEAALDGKLP